MDAIIDIFASCSKLSEEIRREEGGGGERRDFHFQVQGEIQISVKEKRNKKREKMAAGQKTGPIKWDFLPFSPFQQL